MSALYGESHRRLQRQFDTERLADRIEQRLYRTALTDEDRAFIERLDLFFLATVNSRGEPSCSCKGGDPGFVRVLDPTTLVISQVFVDEGPTMKRFRPRAQGRAFRINKRTSHITVVVESREGVHAEVVESKKKTAPKKRAPRRSETVAAGPTHTPAKASKSTARSSVSSTKANTREKKG